MEDKEKADCLIELHNEQLSKFKHSRDIEFKINLTFWSSIVLAGYYIDKEILFKNYKDYFIFGLLYILISALFVAAHYFLWLRPMELSQRTDDHYINQYRTQVEKLTNSEIEKYKPYIKNPQKWAYFESCITAFLLLIVGIYILIGNCQIK